ncbi:MAG: RHS repeat-associated core domain-containing protein [Anaerolineae bacterium]
MTDSSGSITDTFNFDAFGSLLGTHAGGTATNYLFAGQQYDGATGLAYSMRARYYDPSAGRFLSRDTWPVNYADPLELNPVCLRNCQSGK